MNKRNNVLFYILCIISFAFLFFVYFFGTGINKGRETDKDRQRNLVSKSCFTGVISSVTDEEVVITLDSCISKTILFPTEYIPAFTFNQSNGRIVLILNKKRLKISNVAKDDSIVKNFGSDSIIIGKRRFPLFD